MTPPQDSARHEQGPLAGAVSIATVALSEPFALLAWLAVSLAAIMLVRSNFIASAVIALAGGSAIGVSRVLAGSGAQLHDREAQAANEARPHGARTANETLPHDAGAALGRNVVQSAAQWLDRNELLLLVAASPFFLVPLRPFMPVIVLAPLLWVGRWIARGYVSRRSPLNLPVLCLLVMLIPATIAAADPVLSLAKLVGMVFGVSIYAAILNARSVNTSAKTADALVWVALAVGVGSLVSTDWPALGKLSIYDPIYQALPRLIGELPRTIITTGFINPNTVGGTLAWTLPFVIGLWLMGRRASGFRFNAGSFAWQLALGVTIALNAATLLLTQSRSAIGGVTLGLLTLIGVFQAWFRVLLIVAALGATLIAATLGTERVTDFILRSGDERLSSVVDLTLSGRLTIWQEGIEVVRQHAWMGIGLGNFDLVRSSVGVDSSPEMQQRLVTHAHNEFLQSAVDMGIPGLVAFTALLACAFGCLWRLSQHAGERAVRGLAGAILVALVAHQIFGLVDASSLGAKPGFIFWILLGLSARLFADEGRTA